MDFAQLKANLKKDKGQLKTTLKVALLGDTPTQLLAQALQGYGYEVSINYNIYEADFDQIDLQVLNTSSKLYSFSPEYIILFNAVEKLQKQFYNSPINQRSQFAAQYIEHTKHFISQISNTCKARIILFNFAETTDEVFGNYANKTDASFLYQIRRINIGLMDMAQANANLFIADLASLHTQHGTNVVTDPKIHVSTGITFSLYFLCHVAKTLTDIILAGLGRFRKCLILDLDNTLWGGTIGDDGIEGIQIGELGAGRAYSAIQHWAKELKERGILLAICSKNTESIAKEPFEKHPDMALRMADIAVFIANWGNKVDNIYYIQSILNIGFDAMVFIDDNKFERQMVKTAIPDICVPELPEDAAEYMPYLRSLNLFETASLSAEDSNRTKQYQVEATRITLQKTFTSEEEFLANLDMKATINSFNTFGIPRLAQLSQRSNQFNLRTIRYTELDISKLTADKNYFTLSFTLEDKYAPYGLIGMIVLKRLNTEQLFIETWLMSCRVLNRGMENFTLNQIMQTAAQHNFTTVIGEYIATPKNALVKNHYETLGFKPHSTVWARDVKSFTILPTQIKTSR